MAGASLPFFLLTKGRYADLVKKFPTDAARFREEAAKRVAEEAAGLTGAKASRFKYNEPRQIEKIAKQIEEAAPQTRRDYDTAVRRLEIGKATDSDRALINAIELEPLSMEEAKLILDPQNEALFKAAVRRLQEGGSFDKDIEFVQRVVYTQKQDIRDMAVDRWLATQPPETADEFRRLSAKVRGGPAPFSTDPRKTHFNLALKQEWGYTLGRYRNMHKQALRTLTPAERQRYDALHDLEPMLKDAERDMTNLSPREQRKLDRAMREHEKWAKDYFKDRPRREPNLPPLEEGSVEWTPALHHANEISALVRDAWVKHARKKWPEWGIREWFPSYAPPAGVTERLRRKGLQYDLAGYREEMSAWEKANESKIKEAYLKEHPEARAILEQADKEEAAKAARRAEESAARLADIEAAALRRRQEYQEEREYLRWLAGSRSQWYKPDISFRYAVGDDIPELRLPSPRVSVPQPKQQP